MIKPLSTKKQILLDNFRMRSEGDSEAAPVFDHVDAYLAEDVEEAIDNFFKECFKYQECAGFPFLTRADIVRMKREYFGI